MSSHDRTFEVKLAGQTDLHEVVAENLTPGEHVITFYGTRPGYSSATIAAYRAEHVVWIREKETSQ